MSSPMSLPPSLAPWAATIEGHRPLPIYTNVFRASGLSEELILDFGLDPHRRTGDDSEPVVLLQRLVLSWDQAKRLALILRVHDRVLTTTAMTGVLAYASDADGNQLTASVVSGPSNGTLQLNSDGSFTYTPNPGYVGSDSFQYQVSDGQLSSNTATVSLSVTNQPPIAINDSYAIANNSPFTATAATGVLANASDPDGDTLTASVVSQPSYGTLDFHSDGSFTYTPNTGYTGADSFTYEASDGITESNVATVYFNAANDPPKFNAPTYTFTIPENSPNTSAVGTAGATDPDGDALIYSITAGNGNAPGVFAIDNTGKITVADTTRLSALTTPQYTLTAQVSDGTLTATATVTINVTAATGVIARNDSGSDYTTTPGTALTLSAADGVLANDYSLQGRRLFVTEYKKPANGTLDINADGSFTYTPNAGFQGTDTFQYWVSDGTSTANATVTIVVSAPVLKGVSDGYYLLPTTRGISVTDPNLGVLANDAADGVWQKYTAQVVQKPMYASTFTFNTSNGTFTYVAKPGWDGYDSFTYKILYQGQVSKPITVQIMRNGYVYGNPANAALPPKGGVALAGGGTEPPAMLNFLINQANGGNFVVLTYSSATGGDNSLGADIWNLAGGGTPNSKLASVETIAVRNWWDGSNPVFVTAVSHASAIFITGGDQSNYFHYWPGLCGCPNIQGAVNAALGNDAAIGGTSAGMASLGQVAYSALVPPPGGGNLYSQYALANPNSPTIKFSLINGFLRTTTPALTNIVTETHVQPGDKDPQGRMGRLISFLANMAVGNPPGLGTPLYSIAASRSTAVDISPNGSAQIVAAPDALPAMVYFVTAPNTVPQLGNNSGLSWQGIEVIRVAAGGTFNLNTWTAGGNVKHYRINAVDGLLAVEGNNDYY